MRVIPFSMMLVAAFAAVTAVACDDDKPKQETSKGTAVTATPSSAAPSPPPPPVTPQKVQVAVDDTAAFVSGERIDLAAPDPKSRLASALAGKKVEGEELVLEAARETKMPKIALVVAALTAAKAKSLTVHTPKRDRSQGELAMPLGALGKRPDCTAVGFVAKDSAVSTWTAGGTTATRFSRGLAGPDLSRGGPGLAKLADKCDAPFMVVSGDDTVQWGLVVDLALAAMHPEDAGPSKAQAISVPSKTPTPGRKLEDE